MRFILAVLAGLALVLSLGCDENLDPKTPEGAMHRLRDALMARDVGALLDASSAATRKQLAELQTLLQEQRVAIAERYPDDHRTDAKAAFPAGALEAADTAALFEALVEPELKKLDLDERLQYGMSALGRANLTPTGDRATVTTRSGESVEFVLEDEVWKTTVFERAIEQNLNRAKLNRQVLEENLKVFEEMKRREEKKAREAAAAAETP
ncbi:MAG: hypothetical protein R3F65_22335 [bacterium]